MCARWVNGFYPTLALAKLNAGKSINPNGDAQFSGMWFDDCVELLFSAVEFSSPLLESVSKGFVFQSIFAAAKANKLQTKWVIDHISRLEREHDRKPIKIFFWLEAFQSGQESELRQCGRWGM